MWSLLRNTALQWSEHRTARLGAALAYYSVFSLGPLMVIAISIAGMVFGHAAVRGEVSVEIAALLGETGAKAVESMLAAGRVATEQRLEQLGSDPCSSRHVAPGGAVA